jgi:D-alanyl-D-alanine carboxypeptidase
LRTHDRFARIRAVLILALTSVLFAAAPAAAATYAGFVIDAKTGKVLYSKNADTRVYPASLTKMMTLYMLFEAMEAGKVSKSTRIRISKHAASMQPSKLGVPAGGTITAEQAILALVTKSANDVAAAVAEHLGGSESAFAEAMTRKARSIGMKSTTFRNASGLPNSQQVTTARDMATLGLALRDHFPDKYDYFSARSFRFGKKVMGNHNRLLGAVKGVDGIKTGYTRASGFNLVSSVRHDGRSIVAVVIGGKSGKSRNQHMAALISKYLPKASRGNDGFTIARKGGATELPVQVAGAFVLPERGPIPVFRADQADPMGKRIVMAHALSDNGLEEDRGQNLNIVQKLLQITGKRLPVPAPAPQRELVDPVRTAAVPQQRAEPQVLVRQESAAAQQAQPQMDVATAPDGWQIQIGATDSQVSALRLLSKARSLAPGLLSDVENYTETVEKNGATLYRARFAGFDSKSQAWDACGQLKKKKIACLAVQN